MLFAVTAIFKPDAASARDALLGEFNSHLMQTAIHIRLAGALKDQAGARTGVLLLIETDDRAQIEAFVAGSPYSRNALYQSVDVRELDVEVGGFN